MTLQADNDSLGIESLQFRLILCKNTIIESAIQHCIATLRLSDVHSSLWASTKHSVI